MLVLVVLIHMMIHGTSSNSLINSTCSTLSHDDPNIDYAFCTTSLQAAPASGCATLRGLGKISIALLHNNATDARCHIRQLMRHGRSDPYVRQCLDVCFEVFSDALPSVKQAMSYYRTNKFNDANVHISAVMDFATTCEDAFHERSGFVSPLTKRNDDTFQLSAIVLSIINMVQTGSG